MNDAQQLEFVTHISRLICKHIFREINDDELTDLHSWAYASPENTELFEEMSNPATLSECLESFLEIDQKGKLQQIWG